MAVGVVACGSRDRTFVDDTPESDASTIDSPARDTSVSDVTSMPDASNIDTVAPPDVISDRANDVPNDLRVDTTGDALLDVPTTDAPLDGFSSDSPLPEASIDAPVDGSCPLGATRCTGSNLEQCDGTDWRVSRTCATAALCDATNGTCITPTCLPNTYRCSGAVLQTCNADQNGWTDKETCASGGLCDATNGRCSTSACTPGTYQCSGATLQVCRADQTGWDQVAVCSAAGLCNAMNGMCDVAPETTIDSKPANPSNDSGPAFTFSSSKMGSTFKCRVDGTAFADCVSPFTIAVTEGSHTFDVYAIDAGSVPDSSPASYTWSVDKTAPTVTILTYPLNPTKQTDASFGFNSTESGTVECRLDGGAWGVCGSPTTMQYVGLTANTSHIFDVRVTDAATNVGSASFTWTIDTIPPTTTISGGPTGTIYVNNGQFTFSANETATFECWLDTGVWAPCTSPLAFAGLAVGSHTIAVRGTDVAGNVESGASRVFSVAYPLTCSRAAVGTTSTVGVVSGVGWKVCRSDFTTWASALAGGGTYNAVTACRSIGYRSVKAWGGNFNQVCAGGEPTTPGPSGGTDPSSLSITVHWVCDDCGSPPAVNTTGAVGVISGVAWKVCRADWDSAWISAQAGGGTYNAVQACQYLGYRTADAWGGNSNQVCLTESYNGGGGSDPTSLSITVEWRCVY
jgi:hypothetical protein